MKHGLDVCMQARNDRETAEVTAMLEDEHIAVLAESDRDRLRGLDTLTGCPREGDVLLHALPMVAPYTALQGYKLRVKIVPGSQRKGKAARQVICAPIPYSHMHLNACKCKSMFAPLFELKFVICLF